jgi:serine/threonine protein kinase
MKDHRSMNERVLQELAAEPIAIGRYVLHRQIARGGMATIHIARLMGDEGFNRIVAAKRLNPEFTEDAEFVAMFLDEARVASKVQHRNVVPVLDVVAAGEEVILVQEYVHGVPLQWLCRALRERRFQLPLNIAVSIGCQVLSGLHATHETADELGTPLHIVHRDVSPQNVMLAVDGTARLLDFGVAKAAMAAHVTREGTYKGKLAYSAPEQLRGTATRQSDIYSLSVLLWELLVGQRMHGAARSGAELITAVLQGALPSILDALDAGRAWVAMPEAERKSLELLDPIVRKGLAVDTSERWSTAAEMEEALSAAVTPAPTALVAAWLKRVGKSFLEERQRVIAAEEVSWRSVPAAHPARSSGPPPHDSFVNLRAFGRGPTSLPSDLIISDVEARDEGREHDAASAYPFGRLLAPACVLLAALALGLAIIMAWRRAGPEAARVAPPPHTRAQAVTTAAAAAPLPVALERAPEPAAAPAAAEALPAAPQPEPQIAVEQSQQLAEQPRPKPAQRRLRPVEPRREPEPEPIAKPAPAAAPAKAASDCAIPYYFEGSKKLFKAACL